MRLLTLERGRPPLPWLFGLLLALLPPQSAAADCSEKAGSRRTHPQRPRFRAELLTGVEADRGYALLHIEIPYRELGFRKVTDGMRANFDIIVHIFQKGRQIGGDLWSETITVGGRSELSGPAARFAKDLTFPLPPGLYAFEVRISEPASGIEGTLCLGTGIPLRLPGRSYLSAILVGACGLEGSFLELRADRRIGSDVHEARDSLCAYAELHHPETGFAEIGLYWRVIGTGSVVVREGEEIFSVEEEISRLAWAIPIEGLWLDSYRLDLILTAGEEQLTGSTRFSLLAESEEALANFFRETLGVLAYIANEAELQALRMAAPADREAAWDAFWEQRDPTPGDGLNEYKEEFLRRVQVANDRFSVVRKGWRSDRGRIYILYGEPDQIDHERTNRATEIWHYDQLGRRFVFVDRGGYGDYELVVGW